MADFAYSLVKDSKIDGDMYWVRVAADEIHSYTRTNEPLLIVPEREQRFTVRRNQRGLPRYPLVGAPTSVSYEKCDETETLDEGDDYEILDDGRVLRFAEQIVGKEVTVTGDAGWGRESAVGSIMAQLADDAVLLPLTGLTLVGLGQILRIEDELLMVTGETSETNWTVERGVGGTEAVEHDASSLVFWVRPPDQLEAAARTIATAFKVRDAEPGRGVSRPVQVQQGFRLVRTDPLAAFRRDLDEYRR